MTIIYNNQLDQYAVTFCLLIKSEVKITYKTMIMKKNNSTLQSLSQGIITLKIDQIPHFYRKQLKNCTRSPKFLCWFKILNQFKIF